MVRADHHIALRHAFAKGAGLDPNGVEAGGAQQVVAPQIAAAHPADRLHAVVSRDDQIANLDLLHRNLAASRGDGGAGGKADHDLLDLGICCGAGHVAIGIAEFDGAGFRARFGQRVLRPIQPAEVQNVDICSVGIFAAHDGVITARGKVEQVGALPPFGAVIAATRGDCILPVAAFDLIVAFATVQAVVPALTKDRVVALAAQNGVIARFDRGHNGVINQVARQGEARLRGTGFERELDKLAVLELAREPRILIVGGVRLGPRCGHGAIRIGDIQRRVIAGRERGEAVGVQRHGFLIAGVVAIQIVEGCGGIQRDRLELARIDVVLTVVEFEPEGRGFTGIPAPASITGVQQDLEAGATGKVDGHVVIRGVDKHQPRENAAAIVQRCHVVIKDAVAFVG